MTLAHASGATATVSAVVGSCDGSEPGEGQAGARRGGGSRPRRRGAIRATDPTRRRAPRDRSIRHGARPRRCATRPAKVKSAARVVSREQVPRCAEPVRFDVEGTREPGRVAQRGHRQPVPMASQSATGISSVPSSPRNSRSSAMSITRRPIGGMFMIRILRPWSSRRVRAEARGALGRAAEHEHEHEHNTAYRSGCRSIGADHCHACAGEAVHRSAWVCASTSHSSNRRLGRASVAVVRGAHA